MRAQERAIQGEADVEATCQIRYKPALNFNPVGHPDVGPDGEGKCRGTHEVRK